MYKSFAMNEEFIQSRQNPRVKSLLKLRDRSGRRNLGRFMVEGLREVQRCMEGVGIEELYFCPEFFKSPSHADFVEAVRSGKKVELCRLSRGAFEKISNREGCDGVLGVAKQWDCSLSKIAVPRDRPACVVVADAIEKPGNLGALLRSADSSGADALILTNQVCDIFNPSTVRASQGALFSIPIAVAAPKECSEWLKSKGIKAVGAHLAAEKNIWDADFKRSSALVLGSEKSGLGKDWEILLDEKVKIPMHGLSDSMNVGTAAAVFLYEIARQRNNAT